MTAAKLSLENGIELTEQLNLCSSVAGKTRELVEYFLDLHGVSSLDEVDLDLREAFYRYIDSMVGLSNCKRRNYRTILDQVMVSFFKYKYEAYDKELSGIIPERPVRNKVFLFLCENNIFDINDISIFDRESFERQFSGKPKADEYIKALDRIKLEGISRSWKKTPFGQDLEFGERIFLSYHPNPEIAKSLYWIRNKNELVFDFSLSCSEKVKHQVFDYLNHILVTMTNWHERREKGLLPLKRLYEFCVRYEIADIEQMNAVQIEAYRESLRGKVGTKEDIYMQIIPRITRFLFVSADRMNWDSNWWYTERFHFIESKRMNPARVIESFSFAEIIDFDNRLLLKTYLKYQLGIGSKAVSTINQRFGYIKDFLRHCDVKGCKATNIDENEMESYIYMISQKGTDAPAYNKHLISIKLFYQYLKSKKLMDKDPLIFDRYLKPEYHKHHERTVPGEIVAKIFNHLHELPEDLRLMTLILICTGVRVSELCTLTLNSFSER